MKNMCKAFFVIIFLLLSVFVYAREVSATNQAISSASPGDYIIRSSGEKVVLKQADIDYAKRQLGITTNQNTQIRSSSSNNSISNTYSSSSDSTGIVIILLVVVGIVIIIIGICISNITTEVAKYSGMDDESAKKVGKSAGVLAGTVAAIGAAALLGKAGEIKPNKNHFTVTHKYKP